MGTGGFGGGSGSVGGGGSGGAGGSSGARGSLLRVIESLREISRSLIANPDQPRLTRVINELLRERGRSAFFRALLADGFADALLGDLLNIGQRLREGETWADIETAFGINAGPGSMQALCDARIESALENRNYNVDDRYIEQASAAFRAFLAEAVGGDRVIATRGDSREIDAALNRNMFENTIGGFLGDLIGQALEAESYQDLGAATTAVQQAADMIAIAIYDRFDEKFVRRGKALPRNALTIIAENYFSLVTAP